MSIVVINLSELVDRSNFWGPYHSLERLIYRSNFWGPYHSLERLISSTNTSKLRDLYISLTNSLNEVNVLYDNGFCINTSLNLLLVGSMEKTTKIEQ